MGADDGKTLHGFRSGCAITLALTGADVSEIMDHVEWTRRHTALYYLQLAKVLNPTGASARLASDELANVNQPLARYQRIETLCLCVSPGRFQKANSFRLKLISEIDTSRFNVFR
jgi:hypothetical protein